MQLSTNSGWTQPKPYSKQTVYERQANSQLLNTNALTEGEFPKKTHIAQFVYANGLVCNYNGERWDVVRNEHDFH